MLVGRRESCDIVLRFSNVSAHHCQLTVNGGYWHVRDLNSRNGVKVNGVRVTDKRVDPGDTLSIAKHQYVAKYSPVDLGAVGPPPPEVGGVGRVRQIAVGPGRTGGGERSWRFRRPRRHADDEPTRYEVGVRQAGPA